MKLLLQFYKENKILFWLIPLLIIVVGIQNFKSQALLTEKPKGDLNNPDTFIPKGMVLIPIEIQNAEALSQLIGPIGGTVDIFKPSNSPYPSKARLVAQKVKLLRAPLNSSLFAVLVREEESTNILSETGPFLASIQNPESHQETHSPPDKKLTSSSLPNESVEIIYNDL